MRMVHALLTDEAAQGLVEYALIIAMVSVVAIAALTFLGKSAKSQLNSAASAINAG
jgi:pilus assembly protein Flp/PilA